MVQALFCSCLQQTELLALPVRFDKFAEKLKLIFFQLKVYLGGDF